MSGTAEGWPCLTREADAAGGALCQHCGGGKDDTARSHPRPYPPYEPQEDA